MESHRLPQALAGSAVALKCNHFGHDSDGSCPLNQEPNAFVVAKRNIGINDI